MVLQKFVVWQSHFEKWPVQPDLWAVDWPHTARLCPPPQAFPKAHVSDMVGQ